MLELDLLLVLKKSQITLRFNLCVTNIWSNWLYPFIKGIQNKKKKSSKAKKLKSGFQLGFVL